MAREQSETKYLDTRAPISYMDMPEEARALDRVMYNIITRMIKGQALAIIERVPWNSYVQAVILLEEHMRMSKLQRLVDAFGAFDKLTFNGDVRTFECNFLCWPEST